jgi:hypothetical protein
MKPNTTHTIAQNLESLCFSSGGLWYIPKAFHSKKAGNWGDHTLYNSINDSKQQNWQLGLVEACKQFNRNLIRILIYADVLFVFFSMQGMCYRDEPLLLDFLIESFWLLDLEPSLEMDASLSMLFWHFP